MIVCPICQGRTHSLALHRRGPSGTTSACLTNQAVWRAKQNEAAARAEGLAPAMDAGQLLRARYPNMIRKVEDKFLIAGKWDTIHIQMETSSWCAVWLRDIITRTLRLQVKRTVRHRLIQRMVASEAARTLMASADEWSLQDCVYKLGGQTALREYFEKHRILELG